MKSESQKQSRRPVGLNCCSITVLTLVVVSNASLHAAPAEFRLAVLPTPSVLDMSTSVPQSQTHFAVGSSIFLEVWVQTTDPNGISSASLDISFDAALASGVGITPTTVFSELTNGTINNEGGLIDDLSGSHLGPCTDGVGVSPNWARLAVVEFSADADGAFLFEGAQTGSAIYGTAICGVGDIDPAAIIFDSATMTIGNAGIPAVSSWGLVAMCLLIIIAGTLFVARGSYKWSGSEA